MAPAWTAGFIKVWTLVVYDAIETDVTKTLPYSWRQIPTDSAEL